MNNKLDKTLTISKWGTKRLRLIFLTPLVIAILIIIVALSITYYKHINDDLYDYDISIKTSIKGFYNKSISNNIHVMQAIMHTLEQDKKLSDLLAKGDREALLHYTTPLFEDLRREMEISHFYFIGTDSVNLLRVHAPSRYGDVINRITMDQAKSSGSYAYGVELGPLGTFTLRLVAPWYDKHTQTLIGYVELGIDMEHVIEKLQDFFGVQVFTLISKEFIDRKKWENRKHFGHKPDWDHFPNFVLSEQTMDNIPSLMVEKISHGERIMNNSIMHIEKEDIFYRVNILPLMDASSRFIAQVILFTDITKDVKDARNTVYLISILLFIVGCMLIIFFYWLVGRIGQRIENDEKELHELSRYDGLTDLYNHRTFYSLLEEEIERASRYNHSVSLLMLDIDHFKRVNDTYGHQAGDTVLRELSKRLKYRMRSTDFICRYGGEEIMIILTETDRIMAEKIAEDLRLLIEQQSFDIDNGQSLSITVSIGLATYPKHAQELQLLVSNTDKALYKAKEGGRNRVCVYRLHQ